MERTSTSRSYRLVVRGRFSDRMATAFEGMRVDPSAGETALVGRFADQTQLYGLIDRLRDLGIELVGVNAACLAPGCRHAHVRERTARGTGARRRVCLRGDGRCIHAGADGG